MTAGGAGGEIAETNCGILVPGSFFSVVVFSPKVTSSPR